MGKIKNQKRIVNAKINLKTQQLTGAGPAGRLLHKQVWRSNSNERMMTENVGSPLSEVGDQVTKVYVAHRFLCLGLTGKIWLQDSWKLRLRPEKVWNKDNLHLVEEHQEREHFKQTRHTEVHGTW